MKIEFDSTKDEINRQKHGLSLAFGARIFDDPDLLILPTIRDEDDEERYKAVGWVEASFSPPCMSGGTMRCDFSP